MLTPTELELIAKPVAYIPIITSRTLIEELSARTQFIPILREAVCCWESAGVLEALESPDAAQKLLEFYATARKLSGTGIIRPVYLDEVLECMCHVPVALPLNFAIRLGPLFFKTRIVRHIHSYDNQSWNEIQGGKATLLILSFHKSSHRVAQKLSEAMRNCRTFLAAY
jgi:hypothetical protein